jgi:serine protease AprX
MSVAIISGGAASSTLSVATVRSTPQGSYAITVTGASGATTHSTTVTLTVTK